MKTTTAVALFGMTWALVAAAAPPPQTGTPNVYNFDEDTPGKAPLGFVFAAGGNAGKPGRWVIEAQADAPSPGHTLAQLEPDAAAGRSVLAVTAPVYNSNSRVTVKCKVVSGTNEQTCGLVFRYTDENNHYLARADALGGNVRLYAVKQGKPAQVAAWKGRVPAKSWNDLVVEARRDNLRVFLNGRKVIDARDRTFAGGGKVGMCTQGDSVALFDDFTVASM